MSEQTGTENKPKTVLEIVQAVNKKYKMISKSEDEDKLTEGETEIPVAIEKIDDRIDEIKTDGSKINDVNEQRLLYSEALKLMDERDRDNGLKNKLKKIKKKRTELSDDQKKFFGIPIESEESDSTDL